MVPLPPSPSLKYSILDWAIAAQNTLRMLRPTAGPGIRITESTNGFAISAAPNDSSAAVESSLAHPFEVREQTISVDGVPTTQYGIGFHSEVYDGITMEPLTITGLLTSSSPAEDDGGWQDAVEGYIFLEGGLEADGTVSSLTVEVGGTTTPGGTMEERVSAESGVQTAFRVPIAYVWSDTSGPVTTWYFRQEAFRNFTLMYVLVNSVLCKVPFTM